MLFAFIALLMLFFVKVDNRFFETVSRALLCGGALYYSLNSYKQKKAVTVLMAIMLFVGIIYNPIKVPRLPQGVWVGLHIVTMALFYIISLRTPLDESKVTRVKDEADEERDHTASE